MRDNETVKIGSEGQDEATKVVVNILLFTPFRLEYIYVVEGQGRICRICVEEFDFF